jgi:hypothetical protein
MKRSRYFIQETYCISATKILQLMLFIVRTIRNTEIHSVGKMKSFRVLKQVVHIEPLGFKGQGDGRHYNNICKQLLFKDFYLPGYNIMYSVESRRYNPEDGSHLTSYNSKKTLHPWPVRSFLKS